MTQTRLVILSVVLAFVLGYAWVHARVRYPQNIAPAVIDLQFQAASRSQSVADYFILGSYYLVNNQPITAIKTLQKLSGTSFEELNRQLEPVLLEDIRQNPSQWLPYFQQVLLALLAQKYADALVQAQASAPRFQNIEWFEIAIAFCEAKFNHMPQAFDHIQRAMKIQPHNTLAKVLYTLALWTDGQKGPAFMALGSFLFSLRFSEISYIILQMVDQGLKTAPMYIQLGVFLFYYWVLTKLFNLKGSGSRLRNLWA